jgi:pimeloyl-ACP methyl ester carboxylesterase
MYSIPSRGLAWAAALLLSLAVLLASSLAFAGGGQTAARQKLPPIVFVHGSSGSAAQFESHAMRFTSNGYPQNLLYAFEYDTSVDFTVNGPQVLARLDAFIDQVRAQNGGRKVQVVAHSRGTTVMTTYLNSYPAGSSKVSHYVNIDGRFQADLPGGVPTLGIWGEWNSGGEYALLPGLTQIGPNPQDNHHFPNKSHTEVATAPETFALIHRFFTGRQPATTRVLPEPPGKVKIAGRALVFTQNIGYPQKRLELWRVAEQTGQRIGRKPVWAGNLDADGNFGPLSVNGLHHYEFALTRADGSVHHFYQQPFERSNFFLRLNSSIPGTGLDLFVPKSSAHTVLTLTRQRELWGDQGAQADRLSVNGLQILTAGTSPRRQVKLGIYAFDHGLDGQSDLGKGTLPPFDSIPFISAADVFIPASATASGRVRLSLQARGAGTAAQLNVPNWPSSSDRATVAFRDYSQPFDGYGQYLLHEVRCKLADHLRRPLPECE